jgi:hypothetical protein
MMEGLLTKAPYILRLLSECDNTAPFSNASTTAAPATSHSSATLEAEMSSKAKGYGIAHEEIRGVDAALSKAAAWQCIMLEALVTLVFEVRVPRKRTK